MRVITVLLFLFSMAANAQFTITGIVKDGSTNSPLPFATIKTQEGNTIIGDLDGKFIIESKTRLQSITITYTGYEDKTIKTHSGKKFYTVALKSKPNELEELVINQTNKATTIIKHAIRIKDNNDPQLKLNSFRYKTYNKLIVTANPDSISSKLDSVYLYEKTGRRILKIDSTDYKFKKLIEKQHLYQTEKISEFSYTKTDGLKENILATRMAGFKQPLYEFIGLSLQSYSVYNDIDLLETKYRGPLSYNALLEYKYRILDTVYIDNRKTFMIYFTPKRANKKKRLDGLVYIDSNTFGVAKAVFRLKNVLDITSTHLFKFEEEQGIWFPDRKTLKIVKGNNREDINILGETIKFDAINNTNSDRDKEPSDFVYVYSESINSDKEFNIPLTIRRPAIAIEINEEAITRPESYWTQHRADTLDERSIKTYPALDSILTKERIEQFIKLGKRVITGYLPVGFFDFDLRQIVKYNNYEGFRLGVGGITNNKFSEVFRINTYGAYGTKDGQFKYNLGGAVRLGRFSDSWTGGSFTEDVQEIGSTTFATDKRVFKIYDPRPINVSTFYKYRKWHGYIETKIIPKTESRWGFSRTSVEPRSDYAFNTNGHLYTKYNLSTFEAALQWNPFSDFMQTPEGRIEIEKRFPKFTFQYTQAVTGLFESDFTFGKLDFRTEYERKYINGQKTSLVIQGGLAMGDTPITHLYSTSPNNLDKDGVIARITFAGKNSFETMYFNEFFSSQYAMFQVKHAFRRLNIFGDIKLSPVLVTRGVWGNMESPEKHVGQPYNTLEKGFYESGVELNEIFKGLGLTAFYRYGPYHLPEFDRNISIKLSFVFSLF